MPSVSNPLQQAVFRGCVECIRMLVESPPFYNADASCGPEGLRPIHIAAREGHIQTLRFLKSAGACLQKSDVNGATALHHAAIAGQLRAVRWLLRHGAKITLDSQGRSPIRVANDHGHMEIVNILAKHATSGTTGATSSGNGSNGSREPNLSLPVSVNLDQYTTPNANNSGREKSRERSRERSKDHCNNNNNSGTTITVNSNGGNVIKTTVNSSATANAGNHNHNNHNSNNKDSKVFGSPPTVPPPPPPPPPAVVGGTDCASSSGNSSLSASTNTPSLSPSASSSSNSCITSCGCPVSSSDSSSEELKSATETTHSFTLTEFRTKSPESDSKDSASSPGSSSKSFFLHPPKGGGGNTNNNNNITFPSAQQSNGKTPCSSSPPPPPPPLANGSAKKSHHTRQPSTCAPASNSPFFLHPPENLVNETRAVASKMAPAPVNPSHGHHHIQDLINDSHSPSKVKGGLGINNNNNNNNTDFSSNSSSSVSSGSSPPPTPPSGSKPGFGIGCTVSALQGKFQQIGANNNNNKESSSNESPGNSHNFEVHLQNGINNANGGNNLPKNGVPPPPPPPPMPGFGTDFNNNLVGSHDNGPHEPDKKTAGSDGGGVQVENDYEDIEELTENIVENLSKKLVRTTSCPPPPPPVIMMGSDASAGVGSPQSQIAPTKPPPGGGKPGLPFIPPHFPTPPQDALIKPSEYLRSIQNKGKANGGAAAAPAATNGSSNGNGAQSGSTTTPTSRPLSKVEEAIKALGVADNLVAVMSPVPEETNAEDEFEEFNAERINRSQSSSSVNTNENGSCEEKPKVNRERDREPIYASPSALGIKGCAAVIKPEELLKVHLKKTPMSRTRSAPPLGRVVPDNPPTLGSCKTGKSNAELLGNGELRRSNTALNGSNSNLSAIGETTTKAAVIAELAESSQVGGVREWKEELRRRQLEEEKAVQKELANYYQPVNFYAEVPAQDMTGAPIPAWKRQMMAKKAAERARKEAEEQRKLEIEAKRVASIPLWRRQLLQRRESASDGKYAQ